MMRAPISTDERDMTWSPPAAIDPASPDLSIIVVSYNTRALTLACLDSVFAETRRTSFELIVVDNASSDGSADAIAARFPDVPLIRAQSNLGFAGANNLGARRARGELILLLNPDTVVLDSAIDTLTAYARRRPDSMIWGARTLFPDRRLNPASCWRDMDLWNLACRATGLTGLFPSSPIFNAEAYGGWRRDDEREVDIVAGCVLMLPRALWERLDGFDLRFAMYGEETDLCARARALGARPHICPQAEFIHYGGASERVRADKMVRLLKAKTTLIQKHWRWPARLIGLGLFMLWPWSRHVAERILALFGHSRDGAWTEIWRRRDEWRGGFPPQPETQLNKAVNS